MSNYRMGRGQVSNARAGDIQRGDAYLNNNSGSECHILDVRMVNGTVAIDVIDDHGNRGTVGGEEFSRDWTKK